MYVKIHAAQSQNKDANDCSLNNLHIQLVNQYSSWHKKPIILIHRTYMVMYHEMVVICIIFQIAGCPGIQISILFDDLFL